MMDGQTTNLVKVLTDSNQITLEECSAIILFWLPYKLTTTQQSVMWLLANGCTALICKLHCHWLNVVQQCYNTVQYISRNMHTVFALLCFVVVIHWLIFPYPSGLLHWHCGNLTIAPVPAKQPWWIWINTSCELIMNDCITTTKQSTTKPCAYFLGYTVVITTLGFPLIAQEKKSNLIPYRVLALQLRV